jgi:hypothetical protein
VYREISVSTALGLSTEERRPREGHEFLVGEPIQFPQGIVAQYAQMHHAIDHDSYQVRAVGFLAERLDSYLLLQELRRRYTQGISRAIFGCLCVLVPEGSSYSGATV